MSEQAAAAPQKLGKDAIDLLKRTHCAGWSDDEVALFVYQCDRTGLDPLTRQIYGTLRWDKRANGGKGANKLTVQTSIDGFRLVAERTGKYAGQTEPLWCGDDGVWKDVWLDRTNSPAAAKIGVHREGFKEALMAVANFDSYAQTYESKLTSMWYKMGPLMISKCAEALALRKAFPQELSGIYTSDEMMQADNDEKPEAKAKRSEKAAATIPGATSAHAPNYSDKAGPDGHPDEVPQGEPEHRTLSPARPPEEGKSGPRPPRADQAGQGLAGSNIAGLKKVSEPEPTSDNDGASGELIPMDEWSNEALRAVKTVKGNPLSGATKAQIEQIASMDESYVANGDRLGLKDVAFQCVEACKILIARENSQSDEIPM